MAVKAREAAMTDGEPNLPIINFAVEYIIMEEIPPIPTAAPERFQLLQLCYS